MFSEAATHSLKSKSYIQKPLHKSSRFLRKTYTLCVKIFQNLSMIMKNIFNGYLSRKRYMSPGQCCYFISLNNPLIIVPVQGYLMLINHVHLVLLILKQHLLPVYCLAIKQAGLIVFKRKALSNYTLFCAFTALFFHFLVYLSIRTHLSPQGNKLCHDFSTKLIFH